MASNFKPRDSVKEHTRLVFQAKLVPYSEIYKNSVNFRTFYSAFLRGSPSFGFGLILFGASDLKELG